MSRNTAKPITYPIRNGDYSENMVSKDFYIYNGMRIGIYFAKVTGSSLTTEQECSLVEMLEAHGKAIGEEAKIIIEGDLRGGN